MPRKGETLPEGRELTDGTPEPFSSGPTAPLSREEMARRLGTPSGRAAAAAVLTRPSRPLTDDGKVATAVRETGNMFATAFEALRQAPLKGVPVAEFFDQCWFLARVTTLPADPSLHPLRHGDRARGGLAPPADRRPVAARRGHGPRRGPGAGAGRHGAADRRRGGSAMCADLGSRRIRDEISAMEVMGVNPLHRLVLPRLLAATVVAILLDAVVSVAGIAGGWWFGTHAIHITSSSFFATFGELSQLADLGIALLKAGIFGFIAAMVACYKGLYCKSGPKGVGDAVNQAVVVTFILSFFVNFLLTVFYFNFIPQKGI